MHYIYLYHENVIWVHAFNYKRWCLADSSSACLNSITIWSKHLTIFIIYRGHDRKKKTSKRKLVVRYRYTVNNTHIIARTYRVCICVDHVLHKVVLLCLCFIVYHSSATITVCQVRVFWYFFISVMMLAFYCSLFDVTCLKL